MQKEIKRRYKEREDRMKEKTKAKKQIPGEEQDNYKKLSNEYSKLYNNFKNKYIDSEFLKEVDELLFYQSELGHRSNLAAYNEGKNHGVNVMLNSNMLLHVSIPGDFQHTYLVERISTDLVSINNFKILKQIQLFVAAIIKEKNK